MTEQSEKGGPSPVAAPHVGIEITLIGASVVATMVWTGTLVWLLVELIEAF